MGVESAIKEGIVTVLKDLYEIEAASDSIVLQPTKKEFEGSFTYVTFPLTKQLRKAPDKIADELGGSLVEAVDDIKGFNVVKGFLNIEIDESSWVESLQHMMKNAAFGSGTSKGENVMVEYSSPNTNKPLHLGHLRNNFLGYSVSEILKKAGYDVVKANLINDRGVHICKSMIAYQKWGEGETPESAGIKGDHLIGKYYVVFDKEYKAEQKQLIADGMSEDDAAKQAPLMKEAQSMLRDWEAGKADVVALWKKLNSWVYDGFNATYKYIGVDFDKFYYESDTYLLGKELVEEGLDSGAFKKKEDGSIWADLTDEGLDEKLVQRGDGTSVYITQDMGTADLKYNDYKVDKSIYVVGNEQDYHFDVLKRILNKLDRPYAPGIYHLSYGMVDLPSGKMKSREGTVVDADDLVADMVDTAKDRTIALGKIDGFSEEEASLLYRQLALGALKYYLLKVDPKKRMLFNPEESIDFQGDTGVFVQFTHARISAIVRKAKADGIDFSSLQADTEINEFQQQVIETLNLFPKKISDAAEAYSPSVIAQYIYTLAKQYSRFYTENKIFGLDDEEQIKLRLALSEMTRRVLSSGMALLGIESPERM